MHKYNYQLKEKRRGLEFRVEDQVVVLPVICEPIRGCKISWATQTRPYDGRDVQNGSVNDNNDTYSSYRNLVVDVNTKE